MIFDIVNPSDPYSLECDDWLTACLAAVLLGRGRYALDEHGGDRHMPIFLFGGADEWFRAEFGAPVEDLVARADKSRLADCLDSVLICDGRDRRAFHDAAKYIDDPAKLEAFRAEWHDKRRSSLNDIGGRAYRLAQHLRSQAAGVPCG